jgi:hypothetical protein
MVRRLSLSTLLLTVLAAALGAYVYLVEVRGGARADRAKEQAARLLPFPSSAATMLVIERPDGRIDFHKENGVWRITSPVNAAADEDAVTRLLGDADAARIERTLTEPVADTADGLDHPIRLTIAAGDQREVIVLGKPSPTGDFLYARAGSGRLLLLSGRLRDTAEKSLYELRDKTALDFAPDEVAAITLTNRGHRVQLGRAGDAASSSWEMTEPLRAPADGRLIGRSLDLLNHVRAESFASEAPTDLKRFGLDAPWGSARFDLRGGHSDTLLLGNRITVGGIARYYARHPAGGPVFTINENVPADAERPPADWRERHVVDFTTADVTELRMISPERTVVCVRSTGREPESWHLAGFNGIVDENADLGKAARLPTAVSADRSRVEDLLSRLSDLKVSGFLDGADPNESRFGLIPPLLKVIARDAKGVRLAAVSFGKATAGSRYATSSHLGGVYLLPESAAAPFRADLDHLSADH